MPNHDPLCPQSGFGNLINTPCGYCDLIVQVEERLIEQLVEAWDRDSHAVRFNKAKDDLTPHGRVRKWLKEQGSMRGAQ